ncbi:MAG: hypothetical protein WCW25_04950 [Patescibacteria group bacterium]|jgi:hypothetical protein
MYNIRSVEAIGAPTEDKPDKEAIKLRDARLLLGLLEAENPEKFSLGWVEGFDDKLAGRIKKSYYETVGGQRDYLGFISILGEPWESRFSHIKAAKDKEKVRQERAEKVKALLEREKPESFGWAWVKKFDKNLANQIKNRYFEKIDGKRDYSDFVSLLGSEWESKFHNKEINIDRNRTFETCVNEVIKKAREENPSVINPSWVKHNTTTKAFFEKKLRLSNGDIAWWILPDFLPSDLAALWDYKPRHHRDLYGNGELLEEKLREINPPSFGPGWIYHNARKVYDFGRLYLPRKFDKIHWRKLIDILPRDWQSRWQPQFINENEGSGSAEEREYTFSEAMTELSRVLKKKNPPIFSLSYIEIEAPNVYRYLRNNVAKRENGNAGWEKIRESLDEEFKPRLALSNFPEDVSNILEKYRNSLYLLIYDDAGDDELREKMYRELITLAKSGNTLAEEKIIYFIGIMATEWSARNSELTFYSHDMMAMEAVIKRCMYAYTPKFNARKRFTKYVFSALMNNAKRKIEMIELDKPFMGSATETRGGRFNFEERAEVG